MTTIAVTGARGFIGSNLVTRLNELAFDVVPVPHDHGEAALDAALSSSDLVVHLAGVNRPINESEFVSGNQGVTEQLIAALARGGRRTPVVFSSSIQAELDNPYGRSKRAAEIAIEGYGRDSGAQTQILRLPNVFGKWCRPNYNSVVATFCYNISHGLPITISDPQRRLRLVYIDDVVEQIVVAAGNPTALAPSPAIEPVYEMGLGELAATLQRFHDSRATLVTGAVGNGFLRALHATYLSYLDVSDFDYPLIAHTDARGSFVEMLRTPDSGQFSYFTAHPGVTRGGHYHHSKTEKFLVLHGKARFGFRHIITGETHQLETSGETPRVVETVPGWSHDVTNIGEDTMVVMLWANEVFDREKPDTIAAKVIDR